MCGIALIVSGVRFDLSSLIPTLLNPTSQPEQPLFSIDDLEAALRRRGPNSLGSKKVFLHSKVSSSIEGEEATKRDLWCCNKTCDYFCSAGEHWELDNSFDVTKSIAELHFIGATLQLRGINPIVQPLVDTSGNILVYNGEIFGGISIGSDSNDADVLMQYLGKCCCCSSHEHTTECYHSGKGQSSIPQLLSAIKGPWALIYWQDSSRTMWFGRDAFGRRSLLVHWPTLEDSRLLLSSVSPPCFKDTSSDLGDESGMSELNFWEELSCGVYSISMDASVKDGYLIGEVKKHEWSNHVLKELILWERTSIGPKSEELRISPTVIPNKLSDMHSGSAVTVQTSILPPSQRVLIALRESVMRRTTMYTNFQVVASDNRQVGHVPVAVLFSGGLDSMILAALLDDCLDPKYEIDLLNVSFDGHSAPDRISSKAGIKELKRIAPLRRWKLVEIDADLSKLTLETKHVVSLINPAKTYMDLNIGIALWLAAGGDGWVYEDVDNYNDERVRVRYKSEAKILIVGSGADEQCAGYGRHKTKYRHGSWLGLHEEMKLDMQRIWKRNLGRDDRCISDNGKEARFPFLDEDVIRTLLDVPLWEIADLDLPSGIGDKKILREVAQLLGLFEAAVLPKRAIQFGSRIARESNRKNFGSNRAANQASAGSVVIHRSSNHS